MATTYTKMYEHGTTDPLPEAPDPQRATLTPTPPVHHPDSQAPSKRHMIWNPSPALLRLRERAYFPGRSTKSPKSVQKQLTMKNYKHLPVNLPPLQLKNKMSHELVSTPGHPTGPDSTKSDGHSDYHLRDYKRSQKCPKREISPIIPKPSLQFMKTQPHRRRSAVPLRPLQSTSQDLVSTPTFSTWLFSLMRNWEGSRRHDLGPFDDSLVHSRDEYLIVSQEMVVLMCDEPVCMSLECWERLCRILPKIICIPFFAHFKTRRPFSTWRSKVRSKKFNLARNSLKKQLFTLNQCLRPALADIWKMCIQISDTGLCHIEQKRTYTLRDFQDTQVKQLQKTLTDLKKFQDLVKELTICACRNYLSPPTQAGNSVEQMKLQCLTQIKKSFYLNRVSCFIRLVDYLIASTFHQIVVKAVALLLSVLQQRPCQSPSQSRSQPDHAESLEAETSGDPSMFTTELVLDVKALTYDPSEDNFQESFSEIFGQMKQTVMAVGTLTKDPDFGSITEFKEDQALRYKDPEASSLECILSSDEHLQSLLQSIKASLHSAFHTARVYSHTLERFRLFFKANQGLDLDLLQQQDHDLTFFEKSFEMLSRQQKEAEAIQQSTQLGLLLVDKKGFKDKFASSLRSRLEVMNETLAQLARRSLDAVSTEVYEAQFPLKALPPSTTPELGNYLSFLDDIKDRVVVFEKEKERVCQLYQLITKYSVPVSSEDQIAFTQLEPSMSLLRSLVCDALSVRDSTEEDFLACLGRDVTGLSCKLEELKLKLLDPQFLDINSDFLQVSLLLGDIRISIDELQNLASTYTSYQRKFKVEISAFGILEEVKVELRLKQLLWESVQEWDSLRNGWRKSKLQLLDVDQIRSQIMKYDKYVSQLEEGLPKNSVVSVLKDKMEVMRRTLPVITDLRHLSADQESWKTLETVLETSLDVETLTLSFLEEADIISHAKTIQEVTKQLSKTNF